MLKFSMFDSFQKVQINIGLLNCSGDQRHEQLMKRLKIETCLASVLEKFPSIIQIQ